ncbi:MAG: uroporphyrinogen decarboxylase [Anaerolineales bacterium]|nr:MAG: uroporphyrinogen decarboxylase [Anaerolineales bacterium]
MVSKRERLEAAIAKDVADRPPLALWRHFPVDDQTPEGLSESTALYQARYDYDFVKVTPASSFCLLDWGVEDKWNGNPEGTRDYTRRAIKKPADWRELRVLDPEQGSLGKQLKCLELLRERLGETQPIIQTIFNPLSQAKNLAGQQMLFEHLHQEPEEVLAGLEIITQSTVNFIEAMKDRGVDGIFYAIQHGSYQIFDSENYRKFGEVFDHRIFEAAELFWLNVLHLHGEAIMFDLAEKYPVQVVNWHDREVPPSLAEGALRISGAVCGGIRRMTMVCGDPTQVQEEAAQALKSLNSRGVVLGTGCVVPVHAPRMNMEAARTAANCA